jgi:hypothetical protein
MKRNFIQLVLFQESSGGYGPETNYFLEEVKESFLLHSKGLPDKKGHEALRQHLDGLVSIKLLAAEGARHGYLKDERIQSRPLWARNQESLLPNTKPPLVDVELTEIGGTLADHRNAVFVTFKDGQWSLGEFLTGWKPCPPAIDHG